MPNKPLSTDERRRILIVEDEDVLAKNIAVFFQRADARVCITHSAEEAFAGAQGFDPHCMLVDYKLPGMNGLEVIARLRESHPGALFVLMSAQDPAALLGAAQDRGVRHILSKPFPLSELRICLGADLGKIYRQATVSSAESRREELV